MRYASRPPSDAVAKVVAYFQGNAFAVHADAGLSRTIEGPADHFERLFGPEVSRRADVIEHAQTAHGFELPTSQLAPEVASLVEEITFTPPPAFGPTQYR